MKKIILCTLAASTVLLAGCSTLRTTVIPGQNSSTIIATAQDSATATQGAVTKATAICTQQGKRLVVTKNKTVYQGAGKELVAVTSMLSETLMQTKGTYMPSTQGSEDYKTTMKFTCQ